MAEAVAIVAGSTGLVGQSLVRHLVAAMVHDRRTNGRVHPVYWMAGGAVLAFQLLRVPLSTTRGWDHVARWLVSLSP